MAGHGGDEEPTVGGPARHIPVLLSEVVAALEPAPGAIFVDGTFGAGGYSAAVLSEGATVLGIDRDPRAIAGAADRVAASGGRLTVVEGRFGDLETIVAEQLGGSVDGVVLDIGVSSMQIDEAERGFSFQKDGPLDMRMGASGPTAADVVNRMKPGDLARILGFYGEERQAGRIARAIVARREERAFTRTLDLAETIGKVVGRSPKDKIDPATRSFQALRIFVNDELAELARALVAAERVLKPGGRLVVVTFHSLEDRIVKRFLRERSAPPAASRHMPDVTPVPVTFSARNKAVAATPEEAARNPRARSAKLRSGIRTEAAPRGGDLGFAGLPALADLPESGD
ncbi:16S rRNA (cytosine(1402)-N(4))-methyltransferase RsmH [Aurantimonas sp. VKM B-3413]|uniref:16S rRNA (cytosine(1402)-N(4))-methyltransferase RsmH n=1 Tax=Aurantimonas sp. VKM B-3413 TaxID=2779401 RepID=UPI001E3DF8CB|nr:16S rRNA (cytosine(1402)-N(4))-methyltransferase RsmH [Aurantimonas sp. VKM B-3413]MCB8837865.1 16S rRNA (cytosine(1402)-N(4))-methyltransferase RsmH [Aurantimonas sp. VKM B-3413]